MINEFRTLPLGLLIYVALPAGSLTDEPHMFSIPLSGQIKSFPSASLPPRHLPRIRGGGGKGGYLHRGLCGSGLSGVSSSCPHSPQGTCRNSHWHGCSTGHRSGKGWARNNRCPAVKWQSKKEKSNVKQRRHHRFSRRETPDPSPTTSARRRPVHNIPTEPVHL